MRQMVEVVEPNGPEAFIEHWHRELGDWLAGRTALSGDPRRAITATTIVSTLAPEFTLVSATGRKYTREQLVDGLARRHGSEGASFSIAVGELKAFEHGAVIPGSSLIMVAFVEDHLQQEELWSRRRCTGVLRVREQGFEWCRVQESWIQPPPNEPS